MGYNYLTDIPQEVFKSVKALRVADFSHNHLRGLPDNLFYNGGMEKWVNDFGKALLIIS